MKGSGAKIYRHQFGRSIENSSGYSGYSGHFPFHGNGNASRNDHQFYDGDLKPVIKIRKTGGHWKAKVVGHKKVHSWLKRDYRPAVKPAVAPSPYYNRPSGYSTGGPSGGYGSSPYGSRERETHTSVIDFFSCF